MYNANVWPPMALPSVQAVSRNGGIAAAPATPSQVLPTPTETRVIDYQPKPPLPIIRISVRVRPTVTAAGTRAIFGIVNGSDVVPSPAPLA
jgi:hypothetical protein